jgi:hypothetical protein
MTIRTTMFGCVAVGIILSAPGLHAQSAPPRGAVPACESERYLALKQKAAEERSAAEQAQFGQLDGACSVSLIAYYQREADASRGVVGNFAIERRREPAEALLYSILVPGGGQFYNRQPAKGALYFAANVAGWALLINSTKGTDAPGKSSLQRGLGIGLVVGSYWGSLFDAVRHARDLRD